MNAIGFENSFDAGILDDEYMEFIMNNSSIANGDMLLYAFESMVLYDEFKEFKLTEEIL
jgi:hypothetical protein